SGSRVGRSNTAVAGPGAHVEGAGARRTESQSGVEAASGRAGTRDMAPPYPDSARAVIRTGTTRLRQASNTSGAATRWMSGPGANAHNARRMAPSKDIGYVNASVTPLRSASIALMPHAATAQPSFRPTGAPRSRANARTRYSAGGTSATVEDDRRMARPMSAMNNPVTPAAAATATATARNVRDTRTRVRCLTILHTACSSSEMDFLAK